MEPAAPSVDPALLIYFVGGVCDVIPTAHVKWARDFVKLVRLSHGVQVDEGEGGFQRPDLLGQGRLCQEGNILQKESVLYGRILSNKMAAWKYLASKV